MVSTLQDEDQAQAGISLPEENLFANHIIAKPHGLPIRVAPLTHSVVHRAPRARALSARSPKYRGLLLRAVLPVGWRWRDAATLPASLG